MIAARSALLLTASLVCGIGRAEPPDLPETPEAAERFDYCGHDIEPVALEVTLERLDTVVENADRSRPAESVATALLVAAGLRTARDNPGACADVIAEGHSRYEAAEALARRLLRNRNRYDRKRDREIRSVQRRLADLWLEDQVARQTYVSLRTDAESGAAFWASRLATARVALVDAEAAATMRGLLDDWDWIDRERFGAKVSQYAWLLVQHADEYPELQQLALSRMQPYLEAGGIRKADYAYLFDRVAVNAGRKQRYATQPTWECNADGELEPAPLEDPGDVDIRRAELDMKPYRLDLERMSAGFCGR